MIQIIDFILLEERMLIEVDELSDEELGHFRREMDIIALRVCGNKCRLQPLIQRAYPAVEIGIATQEGGLVIDGEQPKDTKRKEED